MDIWPATTDNIYRAAQQLREGKLISFPTETVYGLGADAENDQAVAQIFAVKNRPDFNPLIVHVPDLKAAEKYAIIDDLSRRLARHFWPGPFTLVLPRRPDCRLSPLVSAGLDTVAIRVPQHATAQELLQHFGGPIAAPSANPSGAISPTLASHVKDSFSSIPAASIAGVLDGGACNAGVESTIVQISDGHIFMLRPGSVTPDDISSVTHQTVHRPADPDSPIAPGQLKSHYAPRATVRLNATAPGPTEAYLGFGTYNASTATDTHYYNLSTTGDLTEAAANLFSMLHQLDRSGCATIAVAPIPLQGLGLAINDRLSRAAAPRTAPQPTVSERPQT
ncbi:MAG: threonylcarbamoyl-AMP synthase [Kordiimonas sp.]|nr:threonylcarbamoyl-AMP synthase [Kordiimonas sp.]|tara:strand:- start:3806 stop:4813 length:1008 start_codon:yes stop_codon:yes gene_type:complete